LLNGTDVVASQQDIPRLLFDDIIGLY